MFDEFRDVGIDMKAWIVDGKWQQGSLLAPTGPCSG